MITHAPSLRPPASRPSPADRSVVTTYRRAFRRLIADTDNHGSDLRGIALGKAARAAVKAQARSVSERLAGLFAINEATEDELVAWETSTFTRPVERGDDWPEELLHVYTRPNDPQGRRGRLFVRLAGCGHPEQVWIADGAAIAHAGGPRCLECRRAGR